MQLQLRALALLVALCVAPTGAASSQALRVARSWLRSHAAAAPKADELQELKGANPEAYAIVKALLTKRSLGLLDPKHPTASFARENAPAPQDDVEKGPEAFAKFATPGEIHAAAPMAAAVKPAVDLPYAQVSTGGHKDWMNWKPADAGSSDDAMVANVLGAVAELKGKKAGLLSKRSSSSDENPLTADAAAAGVSLDTPAQPAAPAAQQPAAPHENAYLKSIDFGLRAPVDEPAAPQKKENSYLKAFDLSSDTPAKADAPASKTSTDSNPLTSFSFDDSKPQHQQAARAEEKPLPFKKDSTLLSWLGVVKKAAVRAPAQPAKPANPYLVDLS